MTPFRLVQLSDPHIGGDWAEADPVAGLAAAIGAARRAVGRPDAVLVSGDLVEHGTGDEYETVRELLAPLAEAPLYVLPGNHDDRAGLRRHFGLAGSADEPINYTTDLGPLRLVVLDTTVPGEDPGRLDGDTRDWLDAQLAAQPEQPTLIAVHHSPVVTGIPGIDEIGLDAGDQAELAGVLARHAHVRQIVAGHLHRHLVSRLARIPVLTAPSTYVQIGIDFAARQWDVTAEPPAYVVHSVEDGEIVSYVEQVA